MKIRWNKMKLWWKQDPASSIFASMSEVDEKQDKTPNSQKQYACFFLYWRLKGGQGVYMTLKMCLWSMCIHAVK